MTGHEKIVLTFCITLPCLITAIVAVYRSIPHHKTEEKDDILSIPIEDILEDIAKLKQTQLEMEKWQ